jgi:hypothetical protein
MVHILPPKLNIGSMIGQSLGQGLAGGFEKGMDQSLSDQLDEKKHQRALEQIRAKEQAKYKERTDQFLRAREETEKRRSLSESLENNPENPKGLTQNENRPITNDDVENAYLLAKEYGEVKQKQKESQDRKFEADRKFHSTRSNKFLDEVNTSFKGIPEREVALNAAEAAITSGQMNNALGGDFWANALGIPSLRDVSGAVLNTAAKINLIGSLSRVSARPNQFLEKQIADSFAKAGQTKETNLAQVRLGKSILNMEKNFNEVTDNLADQYRQSLGYVPENIDSIVRKQVEPFNKREMERTSLDIQRLTEKQLGSAKLNSVQKVYPGTPLTPEKYRVLFNKASGSTEEERDKKAIETAKKAGYRILDLNALGYNE